MNKIIMNSGKEYETELNFTNIQALIKTGNLLLLSDGEYINPKNIEKIIAGQTPMMNYPTNNFHVMTDEETKEAQAALQPMKVMFDARKDYDQKLRNEANDRLNSQSIYGAAKVIKEIKEKQEKQNAQEIIKGVEGIEKVAKRRGRPAKQVIQVKE